MTNLPTSYNVVHYNDVHDFMKNTQSTLEATEVLNTFPLWMAGMMASSSSRTPQSYGALFQSDRLLCVYICAEGNSYVGWCAADSAISESPALVHAITELLTTGVALNTISSLHGYCPAVELFHKIRQTIVPRENTTPDDYKTWSLQVTDKQQIRHTRHLKARLLPAGWMDFLLLLKWAEAFIRDCGIHEPFDMWDQCAAEIAQGTAYFWCLDDGIPVAMVWKRRALRHGISLAYVYTPPEHRNKGYAAAMVAQFTEALLSEGYSYVTLLMDGNRDPIKNMYASVGYQVVGSICRFSY
jgi:GNAT superfamily N-acetyltransferase